jgi:hypothetical protein
MRQFLAFAFVVVIFSACNKDNRTTDTGSKKDSSSQNTQKNQNSQQNTTNTTPQNAGDNKDGLTGITYDTGKLPPGIKYDGKIVASAKWTDNNGENYIIVTETEEKNQNADNRMKEMFAYQYVVNGDDMKQLWKINDFIKDCPVDITLQYMPKSLSVTDLNKNGIAETTFLYRMSCKGDVSEDDMKLMMHEGETKYVIRGSMKLKMAGETYGGKMNVDTSFDKAPKEFLDYAKEQWNKFQMEKIGN